MKFNSLIKKISTTKKPLLAVLIDPDKFDIELIKLANLKKVTCFLVGGSVLNNGDLKKTIIQIKKISSIPVVIFPGDETQLCKDADGLLLLSLLSGRNPEYLISKHVKAAPVIKKLKLSYLPTAYLLINSDNNFTTAEITKTKPLANVSEIINTCIAAEQLGFKAIYLEAGSGSDKPIHKNIITQIKKETTLPIILGGGIKTTSQLKQAIASKANLIVIGNALEKNIYLLPKFSKLF